MKQFKQVIQIEVDVDVMARKLLATIDPTFPHRELLVENIIGMALEDGGLGHIYHGLTGYIVTLDFQVGDLVMAKDLLVNDYSEQSGAWVRKERAVGKCKVVEVNIFKRGYNVLVEYPVYGYHGVEEMAERWVEAAHLTLIPPEKETREVESSKASL